MQDINLKPQCSDLESNLKRSKPLFYRNFARTEGQEQLEKAIAQTKTDSAKKTPSFLAIIIFTVAALSLYALGIYQITIISMNIFQPVMEEAYQDLGLRRF